MSEKNFWPRCRGGCDNPQEPDGDLCRGCLKGANIVNRNAIERLEQVTVPELEHNLVSEYAKVRALENELRAVKILDAWLAKRGCYAWEVLRHRGEYFVQTRDGNEGCDFEPYQPTAAAARILAADALAERDPSLLEGIES